MGVKPTSEWIAREPGVRLAIGAWLLSMAAAFLLRTPREDYLAFAAFAASGSAAWLFLFHRSAYITRSDARFLLIGAVLLRIWAIAQDPAFSDDVFRYIFEGRIAWDYGPAFPFRHAPAEAPLLGVNPRHLDEVWQRVNHAEVPTLYPPLAQASFMLAAGLGRSPGATLIVLKLLLVAAELGGLALIARARLAQRRSTTPVVVVAACPLLIMEIARDGHADSLALFGLALGVYGLVRRSKLGLVGFAMAALAKLNGLVALPAVLRTTRRGVLEMGAVLALLGLPILLAGREGLTGLSAYATRWRAGDGVFSVLLFVSEKLIGGDWTRIGDLTVTRHGLARVLTAALFLIGMVLIVRRPTTVDRVPARLGALFLLLLLLSPTLHPWYVTWLIPFVLFAESAQRAMLIFLALAWVGHHAVWLETFGEWREIGWIRGALHISVWLAWLLDLRTQSRSGPAGDSPPNGAILPPGRD